MIQFLKSLTHTRVLMIHLKNLFTTIYIYFLISMFFCESVIVLIEKSFYETLISHNVSHQSFTLFPLSKTSTFTLSKVLTLPKAEQQP
jgi:hypothetical protein